MAEQVTWLALGLKPPQSGHTDRAAKERGIMSESMGSGAYGGEIYITHLYASAEESLN